MNTETASDTVRLTGVQETLLIPLAARIVESRRPDSGFRDSEAERIGDRLSVDVSHYAGEWTNVEVVVGRTLILDRGVAAWMARNPGGQVWNLGAGLCTRFSRLDDGQVRWTDVDLEPVVSLKRGLVAEGGRYRLRAASVLEPGWLELVEPGPCLFVAEGLLMYLEEADVAALLRGAMERSPGAEAWLEAIHPFLLRVFGRRSRTVRATGAEFRWGLRRAADLEALVPGLEVLGVAHPNQEHPERWRWLRALRFVPAIHSGLQCVHARLGRA